MNAKTLIIVGFCLLSFGAGELQANTPETTSIVQKNNDVPHGYEQIELQGSLMLSVGPTSIDAGVNDNSIFIQFNQNLGNVIVTIYNPSGSTVYSGMVNTAVQQLLVIPVTFSSEGIYTIVLENASDYFDELTGIWYTPADEETGVKSEHYRRAGVSAQDVQKILPEAVTADENGLLYVDYDTFTVLLIQAFKEQKARIEQLETILKENGLLKP